MSDSINFSWYLMFWLTNRFGDERTFWKTMTPARCHALYTQYAKMLSPAKPYAGQKTSGSLSQYVMGGG